jgi:hypothetical protein
MAGYRFRAGHIFEVFGELFSKIVTKYLTWVWNDMRMKVMARNRFLEVMR